MILRRSRSRSGFDIDALIENVDVETRNEILREVRGLAFYTKMKKVSGDIWLRCDLLELNQGVHVDPGTAFAELASEDRDVLTYVDEAKSEVRGGRAEDALAWAWFGEDDVLGQWSKYQSQLERQQMFQIDQEKGQQYETTQIAHWG